MKTKIIAIMVILAALAGVVFLIPSKNKETSKNSEAKIQDKIYVAVEEAGEIAVVSIKDRTVIKGLISHPILAE